MTTTERFLDFHAVRETTTISRALVYRLISRGLFPRPVKLGKKSVWPQSEVLEWMQREIERPRLTGRPIKAQQAQA